MKQFIDIIWNFIYLRLCLRIDRIESFTGYSDLHGLFLLARDGSGEGAIVEVGAHKGKSAVVMSLGSKLRSREKVYSIDPHFEGTRDIFVENIKRFGVEAYIVPVVASSEDARRTFGSRIRLLFIDGSHEYDFVKKDIELWKDLVNDGGVIVFHDINWMSVARAVDELIRPSREFIVEGMTGCSLIVSKSVSANNEIFKEIRLFNRLKDAMRPWRAFIR